MDQDLQNQKNQISQYEKQGELFRAYDLAMEALKVFKNDAWLQHRAVLCLANAGAIELAREKFQALNLHLRDDIECITLNGRLFKQLALQTEYKDRAPILKQAIVYYELAWQHTLANASPDAYYPGINVATLKFLVGDTIEAMDVAELVLNQLQPLLASRDIASSERYWPLATAIEAHLILGEIDKARSLANEAVQASKGNFVKLASTAKQLEHVLRHQGLDLKAFGIFSPPKVVHYTGHMISRPDTAGRLLKEDVPRIMVRINEELASSQVVAAYGSLAAGSDILFAEALLAHGVKLHVMLPFNKEEFLDISVRPCGPEWEPRFHHCLSQAQSVYFVTEDEYLGDDSLFLYCSQLAMGFAVLCARHLFGSVRQICIWDGQPARGVAGTAHDMMLWKRAGHPQTIIRCGIGPNAVLKESPHAPVASTERSCKTMLFGDFEGFSKLVDAAIPKFSTLVMGKVAEVFDRCTEGRSFLNTWGDGIFAVYQNADKAAEVALQLQEELKTIDLAAAGLPSNLLLRIGGHIGPVYDIHDPVLKRPNFMGAHVSRTARIEPITLAGCVFITESFAAIIALHNADKYRCDYVGMRELAKNYSTVPVFSLRRVFAIETGPAQPSTFSLSGPVLNSVTDR